MVSTRAEYVSGGDVLVEVRTHDRGAAKHLRIEVDGRDVLSSFREMPDGSRLGLLTGLSVGSHTIVARANGAGTGARRDAPHGSTSSTTRSPARCSRVRSSSRSSARRRRPGSARRRTPPAPHRRRSATATARRQARSPALADPTVRPADLAQTTTIDGRTVDYIVRLERGTIDRAIYEIAALHDPASPPSPFTAEPGWNERLVYTFGGGCNVGYHQGTGTGGVLNDLFLSRGYAVASSSLNVYETNCSEVISAEAALMVKEHFIETYGAPRYTIGWGGSGGAIQQHLIANNYPGILDGIVPAASFQDSLTLGTVPDCRLLALYFASPAGIAAGWTADQRAAASGYGTLQLVQPLAPRVRQQDERARGVPDRDPGVGAVPPGDEPDRDPLHELRADRHPARPQPGQRLRVAAARQHRHRVRPDRPAVGCDQRRAVRLAERARRWLRRDRSGDPPNASRLTRSACSGRTRPAGSTPVGSDSPQRRSSTPARTPTSPRRSAVTSTPGSTPSSCANGCGTPTARPPTRSSSSPTAPGRGRCRPKR